MSIELKIEVDEKLCEQIRSDNGLARDMSSEEITECVEEFLNELKTRNGLSLVLENLDYFNQ